MYMDILYFSVCSKMYWLSRFGASYRTRAHLELNPRLLREDPASDDAGWSLCGCNMHKNPTPTERCAT